MKPLDETSQEALTALGELIHSLDGEMNGEEMARSLLDRVGVLRSVYEMEKYDLMHQPGMTKNVALALDLVDDLKRVIDVEVFSPRMKAGTFAQASPYFHALMSGRRIEYCYMMCLNGAGFMISCPLLQRGTVDQSAVYVQEVARTALMADAKYAILAHNHPGGSTKPSAADLQVTINVITGLRTVDVALLDHVIVTDEEVVSIRALGQPRESFWLKGREKDRLLKNWNKG